jgi:hypothetical protein
MIEKKKRNAYPNVQNRECSGKLALKIPNPFAQAFIFCVKQKNLLSISL